MYSPVLTLYVNDVIKVCILFRRHICLELNRYQTTNIKRLMTKSQAPTPCVMIVTRDRSAIGH